MTQEAAYSLGMSSLLRAASESQHAVLRQGNRTEGLSARVRASRMLVTAQESGTFVTFGRQIATAFRASCTF